MLINHLALHVSLESFRLMRQRVNRALVDMYPPAQEQLRVVLVLVEQSQTLVSQLVFSASQDRFRR